MNDMASDMVMLTSARDADTLDTTFAGLTVSERGYVREYVQYRLSGVSPFAAWSRASGAREDECPIAQRARAVREIEKFEPFVLTERAIDARRPLTVVDIRERLSRAYAMAEQSGDAGSMIRAAMALGQMDGVVRGDGSAMTGSGGSGSGGPLRIDVRFVAESAVNGRPVRAVVRGNGDVTDI